jgi:alpha-mannosidase
VHRHDYDDVRFRNFQNEVLAPASIAARGPCRVDVWQTQERCLPSQAREEAFEPVQLGWRWGPAWSTAWFRVDGQVPEGEGTPAVRFSSGTEALLYQGDVPYQGLDANHTVARLASDAEPPLLIEAACNLPLGISTFWWDEAELRARWQEQAPGRLEFAEFIRIDEAVETMRTQWDFARKLLSALPRDSSRGQQIADALHAAMAAFASNGAAAASEVLTAAIEDGAPTSTQCAAIGHAHIDTAWLWGIGETIRKCSRTFATMLRHMERHDDFVFLCSQPQQYAWIAHHHPDLFKQIAARVSEGRWDASGAMWVEPDCLIPSGESLIRQILHGTAWWADQFGKAAPQRHLYLPDTFGFPASLPQIAAQAGLDTFITNKIAWNEVNAFPHVTFKWRGIDGTELVSHMTPGHNYNSEIAPSDLLAAERNVTELDQGRPSHWLQPFGYGDGGGGPTEMQIARVHASARCGGLPRTGFSRVDALCEHLHADADALPVWDGELYMEGHRGCYTSHRWLKDLNLRVEEGLRVAEAVACEEAAPEVTLQDPWRLLLLNQFHDILPGSSINEVYVSAWAQLANAQSMIDEALEPVRQGFQVYNPASTERSGVIVLGPEEDLTHYWIDGVQPLSSTTLIDHLPSSVKPVQVAQRSLDNGLIRVEFGDDGTIHLLRGIDAAIPVNLSGSGVLHPMNVLHLFEDRPRQWDAWNLDHDYASAPVAIDAPARVEVTSAGPFRGVIEVVRSLGSASSVTMRYTLDAGARRLDIEADVDWKESRRVLRVGFQTGIRSRHATCGIQFGAISRPTHRNTSWEQAQFEVPGHRWVDLSEPGRGLAVLEDGIHGRSLKDAEIGLTLLRAPVFPDPTADRGEHTMRWALMPHAGDWRAAGVDAEAEAVTRRFLPGFDEVIAPFRLETIGEVAVEIAAVKPAEDGNGRIVRLVEKHGGHGTAVLRFPRGTGTVSACDVLERPVQGVPVIRDDAAVRVPLRPFGIVSLRIEPVA